MGTCKKDNKTAIFETQYERKLLISSLLLIIIKKLILPSQKIIVLSINITSEKQWNKCSSDIKLKAFDRKVWHQDFRETLDDAHICWIVDALTLAVTTSKR